MPNAFVLNESVMADSLPAFRPRSSVGYTQSPATTPATPLFDGVGNPLEKRVGKGQPDRLLQSVINAWPNLKPDVRKMIAGVAVMAGKQRK